MPLPAPAHTSRPDLTDRVVMVTGATGGLGEAITRAYAAAGATVVLHGRVVRQLEALYDIGRALSSLRPEGDLLEELMQRAISVLDATIGFAVSLDAESQLQHLYALGLAEGESVERVMATEPVKRVLALRTPLSTTVVAALEGSVVLCRAAHSTTPLTQVAHHLEELIAANRPPTV